MKNYKKVLAAALAMTMVAGSSVMAAAPGKSYVSSPDSAPLTTSSDATGTITGGGQMEGSISKDVFHIVVPSSVQGANAANFDGFNFVMDPQKLITETEAAKYVTGSNITADGFEPGKTLYFVNKSNRRLDNTSDYVKVTNKSSIDVEVSLAAEMKTLGSITMSDTDQFTDNSTSLYLAVIGGTETKAIDATDGAEVTGKIAKAKDGAYDIVYDDAGGYAFKLVKDEESLFSTYEFALTGATNENGNWLNVTDQPSVELTWKVEPVAPGAPSIAAATYEYTAGQNVVIAVNLGGGNLAATDIASLTYEKNGEDKPMEAGTDYTFANGKLTLLGTSTKVQVDREFTITFNDKAATTATFTLQAP